MKHMKTLAAQQQQLLHFQRAYAELLEKVQRET